MLFLNSFFREGSYFSSRSAPRANTKSRSPSSAKETKAKVVNVSDWSAIDTSTFSCLSVSNKKTPKGSLPTHPTKLLLPPSLAMAQATLAGAPPAFFVKLLAFERLLP